MPRAHSCSRQQTHKHTQAALLLQNAGQASWCNQRGKQYFDGDGCRFFAVEDGVGPFLGDSRDTLSDQLQKSACDLRSLWGEVEILQTKGDTHAMLKPI